MFPASTKHANETSISLPNIAPKVQQAKVLPPKSIKTQNTMPI